MLLEALVACAGRDLEGSRHRDRYSRSSPGSCRRRATSISAAPSGSPRDAPVGFKANSPALRGRQRRPAGEARSAAQAHASAIAWSARPSRAAPPSRSACRRGVGRAWPRTRARHASRRAVLLFPDAVQRVALRRRSGIVPNSEFRTLPGSAAPHFALRAACCAVPGTRANLAPETVMPNKLACLLALFAALLLKRDAKLRARRPSCCGSAKIRCRRRSPSCRFRCRHAGSACSAKPRRRDRSLVALGRRPAAARRLRPPIRSISGSAPAPKWRRSRRVRPSRPSPPWRARRGCWRSWCGPTARSNPSPTSRAGRSPSAPLTRSPVGW